MDLLRDFFTDVGGIVQCRPFGVDSGVANARLRRNGLGPV